MIHNKVCKNCGEVFFTGHSNKKYCNKKCRKKAEKEISLERMKEYREISREIGNCTCCFKPKNDPRYKHCFKCREHDREYYKLYYKRKRKKK